MNFNQIEDNKGEQLNNEMENQSGCSELSTTESQMILTDLNADCLDKIFRYLSTADLGSVSETCTEFREIAIETFKSIWKNKVVILYNNNTKEKLDSLRILRQFGYMLQKVNIDFSGNARNVEFLDIIIKKRCKLNLVEIEFSGFTVNDTLDRVLNIRNLYRFNKHFNNLMSLRFGVLSDNLVDPNCIEQKFSQLQSLSLQHPFNHTHLKNFITFNSELKSLEFGLDYEFIDRNLMVLIDKMLPQLEELKLMEISRHFTTVAYVPRFLKNLKRLKIRDLKNGKFLPNLSISNEKVEDLDIEVFSCNDNLIDTICQYNAVQKLSINCLMNNFRGKDLIKFSTQLPRLSKIVIRGYNGREAGSGRRNILQFFQETVHLTTLTLLHFTIDMKDIKQKLDPFQWRVFQSYQKLQICKYNK